jgi:hypothetical protein
MYRIFPPYLPSYTLSLYPLSLPPTGANPSDKTCFAFLFSIFVKKKKKGLFHLSEYKILKRNIEINPHDGFGKGFFLGMTIKVQAKKENIKVDFIKI